MFENAEGSGKPYVELAYNKYKKPLLFTELGYSRFKNGYQQFIQDQLSGYKKYQPKNPEKLLGLCFFQFADKVWKQGTSEGMFGVFSHGNETLCTISYDAKDFTHWDEKTHNEPLRVDNLIPTPIYDILIKNYKN